MWLCRQSLIQEPEQSIQASGARAATSQESPGGVLSGSPKAFSADCTNAYSAVIKVQLLLSFNLYTGRTLRLKLLYLLDLLE